MRQWNNRTVYRYFITLTLLVLLGIQSYSQEKKIYADSFINQKAPELIVEEWISAEPEMDGKFILIDFWATWCPPCRRAIPEMNAHHEKFGDKLVVIGLSDEKPDKVRNFNNPTMEYFSATDTQKRTKTAVNVQGIPHVMIIDPNGIVRWEGFPVQQGYELTEEVIAEIIATYSN